MSRFFSPRFGSLKAYVPGEQPKDKRYIKLNTNESPYPPAPEVAKAIDAEAVNDLRLYGDPECSQLKAVIAGYLGAKAERIYIGNGSDEILNFAFMAFCDEKTGVSYPDISYGFYPVYANLYGLQKNEIPLAEDFSICPEDYFELGTTIVIANPNAPTGICLSVADIEKIVKANENNVVVIDEAYVDFGGQSCIALTEKYDNLLVVQTFSKSRSFAGARLGFAVGAPELIADLEKLRYSTNPFNINRLTMLSGIASIENQEYYDNNSKIIIRTRDITAIELKQMGFELTDSRANFLFARHPKMTGKVIYEQLRSRGILVRHFAKPRIEDYVRITVGTPEDMKSLCAELKEMLNNA